MLRTYYQDGIPEKIFRMLNEYCAAFDEYNMSGEPYAMQDIEYQVSEALAEYFPIASDYFSMIVDRIHVLVEDEAPIDISEFEDDLILVYNCIRQARNKKTWNWFDDDFKRDSDYYDYSDYSDDEDSHIYDQDPDQDELYEIRSERAERTSAFVQAVKETIRFIEESSKPVQRQTLVANIKDFSDAVMVQACRESKILSYHGEYIYAGNLDIPDNLFHTLRRQINFILRDHEIHHIDELYDEIAPKQYLLLSGAYVQTSYQFFSLVAYLFEDDYNFVRPFIAQKSVHIPTIPERVIRFIGNNNEILIDDVISFTKKKGITIPRLLELFDDISNHFFIKNHDTLISRSSLSLNNSILEQVADLIIDELKDVDCIAIRDLRCLSLLPSISVPWEEWLIYSIIRKHIPSIHTYTTSSQFRHGIPVISLTSMVTEIELSEIAQRHEGNTHAVVHTTVDNLDNLDELIEDMIDFNWEDEDEL